MKMHRHGWISGVVLVLPILCGGQTSLSGRAVDRAGVPLQGISIGLQATGGNVMTDAAGLFALKGVSDGIRSGNGTKSGSRLTGGNLSDQFFFEGTEAPTGISVRDIKGGNLQNGRSYPVAPGQWRIEVPGLNRGAESGTLYLLSIQSGSESGIWKVQNGRMAAIPADTRKGNGNARAPILEKTAAWMDTLVFRKYGLTARKIRVTSPVSVVGDVLLPFYSGPGDSLFLKGYENYFRNNDWPGAVASFTELSKRHPGTPNALAGTVYLGKTHYAAGSYPEAIQVLNGYLTLSPPGPDAADALYFRGRSNYQINAFPEARSDFAKVRANYAGSSEADGAAYYNAKTWYQEKAYAQALTEFQAFPLSYPTSGLIDFAQLNEGKSQMRLAAAGDSSRYLQAMAAFRKVIVALPASVAAPAALENLGECLYFLGKYDSARIELNKVESVFPGHPEVADAVYYLGRCDVQQNIFEAAIAKFRRVFEDFPNSTLRDDAHFQIGKTLYLAGKVGEAVPSLSETRRLYPLSTLADNVSLYLVRSYVKIPDCTKAKAELADMRSRFPSSALLPLAEASQVGVCP